MTFSPSMSRTRSSFSASSTMHMSDLDSSSLGTGSRLSQALFNRKSNEDDFVQSCVTSNRDIESARKEVQALMTKATAYSRNSGVDTGNAQLPSTPPRYGASPGKIPKPTSPYTTSKGNSFFQSSPSRTIM